ncbi:ABC transporter substrate-binding protein [Vallitalea maricola]|uniref:Uncharacterized protein n=1 Tax=Vallitalea maricola TaxID=3074433 RepID=A0ACB5UJ65_9FIRM|nr:hypothetical protein AN2V17_11930 [Vallitalea sp. AN17-2]
MKRVIAVLLILSMVLMGCGSAKENDSTKKESPTKGTEAKEVELKLFIAQPRFREIYEDYIDKFAEEYEQETGIKVTYSLEMPSADTAKEILKTRLSTGDDLDIFAFNAINEKVQYYKAGYLEDLSNEPWTADLYDTAKQAVTYEDKVVALPLESLTWGILYNKDLFEELELQPALTLSDLQANTEAIAAAGKTPFLTAYNEAWIPQLLLPLTVGAYVNTSNPDFIDKMYVGESSFEEIKDMFNVIDLIHTNANKNGLEVGGVDGCAEFASGEYGMWVQGPWYSSTILESNPDFNIGVAPLPVNDDPKAAMINASVSTSLGVSKFSKNKEVAKALVAYFLNPETSTEFFTSCQFNPISNIHTFEAYPWINEAVSYVEQRKSYVDPSIPQAVKDESGKALQGYYSNTATADDVIAALNEAWRLFNEINQ